jgi:hypothetical protein
MLHRLEGHAELGSDVADWVNCLSQHQGAQWACSMTELLGKLACGDSILVSDVWIASLTG